jgi:hypothetical protein
MRVSLMLAFATVFVVGAVAECRGDCWRCNRRAVLEEFTNSGPGEIAFPESIEGRMESLLGSSCFNFVASLNRLPKEDRVRAHPRPPEYAFRGSFETGIDAGKDDIGHTQVSRLTLELWFIGAPRQMIKTWTTLSTLNSVSSQYNRMFNFDSSLMRQDVPIEALLVAFEQPPDSCTIDLRGKEIVRPGEEIPIDLKEFKDTQGRTPKPFNRILVQVAEGKVLNGTPWENFPENKIFLLDKDVVTLRYQAPTDEGITEDTLWVKDACEILPDTMVPMGKVEELGRDVATRKIPIRQGSSATLKVSCQEQIEIHRYDVNWDTKDDVQRTRKSEYTLSFSLESKPDPEKSHGDKVGFRVQSSGVQGAQVTEDETGSKEHAKGTVWEKWKIHLDAKPQDSGKHPENHVVLHVDRKTGRPFGVHFPFISVDGSWQGQRECKGVRRAKDGGYEEYDCSHDLQMNGRLDQPCVSVSDECWKIKGDPASGTLQGGCTRTFKSGNKTARASYEWEVNAD